MVVIVVVRGGGVPTTSTVAMRIVLLVMMGQMLQLHQQRASRARQEPTPSHAELEGRKVVVDRENINMKSCTRMYKEIGVIAISF